MTASTNPRRWLSPLTTVFFAAVGGSGILMWLHLRVPGVTLLHEITGLLFTAVAIAHLVLNWRVLCAYFRKRAAWNTLLAGILLCTALAAMDLARGGERQEGHRTGPGQHERRPW